VLPSLKANALYEGVYPLPSALSRPIIVEKLVEKARECGADGLAHGCTGKGNDQVRFEISLAALAPDIEFLAPARHWGFTRENAIKYAKMHGIEVEKKKSEYSIDENLWGRAIECGVLEDAWAEPPADVYTLTVDPLLAPDKPDIITIDFTEGTPTAIDGKPMSLLDIIVEVGSRAGASGIGRIDHVESRTVGIKSREIYECPAAIALITAHKALEAMVLAKDEAAFKAQVDVRWAQLAYEGKWYAPLMYALNAFINTTQAAVTGAVRLKMYKGTPAVVGRKSPCSLYDEGLATYGEGDPFEHSAADGFLKIVSMETATMAKMKMKNAAELTAQGKDNIEVHEHEKDGLEIPAAGA
jgi:argininosuccinate synthase